MKKLCLFIAVLCVLFSASCSLGGGTGCTAHTDGDKNGYCDKCGTPTVETVNFYVINDLHGKISDSDASDGVDELTTYLKNAKKERENVVILATGDMWQGSGESNSNEGQIVTDWMNHIGVSAMALGNHEFDWGTEPIRENKALADFPFLALNVFDKATGELADYCTPSVMLDLESVKLGIIGAIGDCYSSIVYENVKDVYFATGGELTELVKTEAEKLRGEGADVVVYLLHDGSSKSSYGETSSSDMRGYYDTALSNGYVDLVFEAHTHKKYVQTDIYGVYHVQGSGDNKGISHVELEINYASGQKSVKNAKFISSAAYNFMQDDPIVKELEEKYGIDSINGDLGKVDHDMSRDELGTLAAELYYELGLEYWKNYPVVLGGGVLSARSPGRLEQGKVTYNEIYTLFPFDNRITLCTIKGSDLLRRFIDNDDYKYYVAYADGLRESIDPDGIYYIVTDKYCSDYAPNRLTVVEEYEDGVYVRDLMAEYIKNGK